MPGLLKESSLAASVGELRRRLGNLDACISRAESAVEAHGRVDLYGEDPATAQAALHAFGRTLDPVIDAARELSDQAHMLSQGVGGLATNLADLQRQRGEVAKREKRREEQAEEERRTRLAEAARIRALLAESEPVSAR